MVKKRGNLRAAWRMEVVWEDTTIFDGGWHTLADTLADRDVVRCTSVGIVIADDKQGIVLASGVHRHQVAGATVIPRGAIVKQRRLR
jgi:hypothetical protein